MSAKKRAEIIEQFQQPIESNDDSSETEESEDEDAPSSRRKGKGKAKPKTRSKKNAADNPVVMLISLKSGSVGINLTAAQVKILKQMLSSQLTLDLPECLLDGSILAERYRSSRIPGEY